MKEIIIRSREDKEMQAQILDGEIASFQISEGQGIDGDGFIYEIYRVLKKVDELGGFNHIKEENPDDVIYV